MLDHSKHANGSGATDGADSGRADDCSDWDDYVPECIHVSEAERQRLKREHEKYVAELIEEVGEPTPEEMARAEAWWRPIGEHLHKSSRR